MTARRRLSVQSLEANLRLYLKELGASYMFELLQMRNADGKNDNFLFFCSFEFIILQMCCKLTTNDHASTSLARPRSETSLSIHESTIRIAESS